MPVISRIELCWGTNGLKDCLNHECLEENEKRNSNNFIYTACFENVLNILHVLNDFHNCTKSERQALFIPTLIFRHQQNLESNTLNNAIAEILMFRNRF